MALSPKLHLKQVQKLSLTPALRQSIAILKMSAPDLVDLIAVEQAENPILTVEFQSTTSSGSDAYQFAIDTVAHTKTLAQSLQEQLGWMNAPSKELEIAGYLAGLLDENGYLLEEKDSLVAEMSCNEEELEKGIALLQLCEPTGVGARNLFECLTLQLKERNVSATGIDFILNNLEDFANLRWAALIRKADFPLPELKRLAKHIKSLNPHPAENLTQSQNDYLHADVLVTENELAEFEVSLNNSLAPTLKIDANLTAELQSGDQNATEILAKYSNRANTLIRAIEDRSKTLLRVANSIVALQIRFFKNGPEHLTPMTIANLTEVLPFHPSTISRTMSGKSLSCRQGIFPLTFFLTKSLPSLNGQKDHSAFVVQQEIRKMIGQERSLNILSDEAITAALRHKGVDIARRTVAKYRQCMKIPSSIQRRRSKQ